MTDQLPAVDIEPEMQSSMRGKSLRVSTKMILTILVLLGIWLRFEAGLNSVVQTPIRADAAKYVAYAYNINHFAIFSHFPSFSSSATTENIQPDAMAAPGYPALLALLLGSGQPDWSFVRKVVMVQALIGTALIPLTFLISRSLMTSAWALAPAALTAISPKLIISGTYILTETLFTTLMLTSLAWITLQPRHARPFWFAVVGGLLIGLTALVRPTLQWSVPFVLLATLPALAGLQRWKYAIGMILGFCLVSAPWAIRNTISTGHSSDPTLTISTLVHGHYPDMMFDSRQETKGYPYRYDPEIGKLTKSIPDAISGITERVAKSPTTYLKWYIIGKPISFLSWSDPAAEDGIFTYPVIRTPYAEKPLFTSTLLFMRETHWLWVILAVGTALLSLLPPSLTKASPEKITSLRVLGAIAFYFTLVHMLGFPIARYCIPLLPVIFILAVYGIFWMVRKRTTAS